MVEVTVFMRVVVKEFFGWGGLRRCCYGIFNIFSLFVVMYLRNRESVLYFVFSIFFFIFWLVR